MSSIIKNIIREELVSILELRPRSKYTYDPKAFSTWTRTRLVKYWDTLHSNYPAFADKVAAIGRHMDKIDDPEEFVARLQKKVTGMWPEETMV